MLIDVHMISGIMKMNVEIDKSQSTEDILESIFCLGNDPDYSDNCSGEFPSISSGDVIEFDGKLWMVMPAGFKQISTDELERAKKLPRVERTLLGFLNHSMFHL